MKYRLPSLLTVALALPAIAVLVALAQNQLRANPESPDLGASVAGASSSEEPLTLLDQAIATLISHESVTAKVRQRLHLFGIDSVGTGIYLQGPARLHLRRIELKLQVEDTITVWQQVCDGEHLWTFEQLPEPDQPDRVQVKLNRVDARKIRAAMKDSEPQPAGLGMQSAPLGGLPQLLESLAAAFDFYDAKPAKLGTMPAIALYGRWNDYYLDRLLPGQSEAIAAGKPDLSKMRPQCPEQVVVYLGREDLFPYRIAYTRADQEAPLMTMELYEVRINGPLDPQQFIYRPGNVAVHDDTRSYMKRYGLSFKRRR